MQAEIKEMQQTLANITARVTINEKSIESLETKNGQLSTKLDESSETIVEMRLTHNQDHNGVITNLKSLENEVNNVKEDLQLLTNSLESISINVEKLSNNTFLAFTSELDAKKITGIIIALLTFLISQGVFSYAINDSSEALNRLKEIEQILEENYSP